MRTLKKTILSAGLGQLYFDLWWRKRCSFEPLSQRQIEKGFYFVHIPKTAGTSVLSALGVEKTPYTHCPARIIHQRYPAEAKKLQFFSVVRDPFERFASSFEYITKRSDWPAQRAFASDVIGDLSFTEFTSKMASNRLFRNLVTGYEFFFPQSYFTHNGARPLVCNIVRFENLENDFDQIIRSKIAGASALPSLRNHGGGDYRALYDDTAIELVRNIYAQDFSNFGYAQ